MSKDARTFESPEGFGWPAEWSWPPEEPEPEQPKTLIDSLFDPQTRRNIPRPYVLDRLWPVGSDVATTPAVIETGLTSGPSRTVRPQTVIERALGLPARGTGLITGVAGARGFPPRGPLQRLLRHGSLFGQAQEPIADQPQVEKEEDFYAENRPSDPELIALPGLRGVDYPVHSSGSNIVSIPPGPAGLIRTKGGEVVREKIGEIDGRGIALG